MRETPNFAKQEFLYRLSRSDYEKLGGKTLGMSRKSVDRIRVPMPGAIRQGLGRRRSDGSASGPLDGN